MEIKRKNPLIGRNGNSSPESPYLWQISISDKKIKTRKSHSSAEFVERLMGTHVYTAFINQLIIQTHGSLNVFSYKVKAHSATGNGLGQATLFLVHFRSHFGLYLSK